MAVLGAAVGFGSTFALVRLALTQAGPYAFLALRFGLAAVMLWIVASRRTQSPHLWRDGLVPGVTLLGGYVFQTVGLRFVTGPISAFLTYTLVLWVPLILALLSRRWPRWDSVVAMAIGLGGVWALSGASPVASVGDLLSVAGAVGFAANIVSLGVVAHKHDPFGLAAVQMTVVCVGTAIPGLFLGGWSWSAPVLLAAVATAVVASAIAFPLQVWGQRRLHPARVSILMMAEPVAAAIVGVVAGVSLGERKLIGALAIAGAVVLSESRAYRGERSG